MHPSAIMDLITGPGSPAVVAGLLFYMWKSMRKDRDSERAEKEQLRLENKALQDRLLQTNMAQTETMARMEGSITRLRDIIDVQASKIDMINRNR